MNLSFLGPFHPHIVHTPIVLLILSALLALLARLLDRDWLRKASVLMLVIGFVGAVLAEQSGKPAHRVPERKQGVPEEAIDAHQDAAGLTTRLAGGALVALGVASRVKGGFANALAGLALLLQIGAAVAVGVTGYRGGKLVFEHGANVSVDGTLVKSIHAGEREQERPRAPEAGR